MARLRNGKCVAEKEEGVEPVKKRGRDRARNAVNQNKDEEEELLENRDDDVSDEARGKRKKVEEVVNVNVKLRRKVVEKGKKTQNQNQEKNVEKINKHDPKVASSFFFFGCFLCDYCLITDLIVVIELNSGLKRCL